MGSSLIEALEANVLELVAKNATTGLNTDKAIRVLARRDEYAGCPDGDMYDWINSTLGNLYGRGLIVRAGGRYFPTESATAG